jgi:uncharacterized protein (TIGR02266 family)
METKKILIADDVDFFLEVGRSCFQEEFHVILANNGEEAYLRSREEKPDLVFMDLSMPKMSGAEACLRIKSDPELCNTPVVMVVVGSREEDLAKCRDAGCDDILVKPLNRQKMQDMARKHLNIRNRRDIRYKARLQVRYGVNGEKLLADYSINLSTGGLFLETTNPLPEGTKLTAEFALPVNNIQISCNARVAWVNHPKFIARPQLDVGMGLQFLDLTSTDMDHIRDYIKNENLMAAW